MLEAFRGLLPGPRALRWGLLPLLVLAGGCGDSGGREGAADNPRTVGIDGSSTVYLISEAVAEEFQARHPDVRVTVGISGSGGGFQKFCVGETDISDASREINRRELEACLTNGIVPIEIVVGLDGITVVANAANDFVRCLTTGELRRIWQPGSNVRTWSDVRPGWPDDDGDGCVTPNPATIETRAYSPLARPLFLYINPQSLKRREVQAFAEFYLKFAREFLPQVGYVPLSEDRYRMRLEGIRWRAEE